MGNFTFTLRHFNQNYKNEPRQERSPSASFEVDIPKELNANPPVKQRLETRELAPQPTLEQIQEKLEKAYERKTNVIATTVSQVKETTTKVELYRERRSSNERAQGEKTITKLGEKLQAAEVNRKTAITNIQEKAKSYNNKVQLVRERKSSNERAQEEKFLTETAERHKIAE